MLGNIIVGVCLLVCIYLFFVPFRLLTDAWLKLWEPTPENTDRETSSNRQTNAPIPPFIAQPTTPPKSQATPLYILGPAPPATSQTSINITPGSKPSITLRIKRRPFPRLRISPPNSIPADIFERPLQRPPQYSLPVASESAICNALPKSPARTPRSSRDRCRERGMLPGYEPQTSRVEVLRVEREPKNFILTSPGARMGLLGSLKKDREESKNIASEEVGKGEGMMRVGLQVADQSTSDERGGGLVGLPRSERIERGSVGFKRKVRDTWRVLLGFDKEMWAGAIRGEDAMSRGAKSGHGTMLEGTHENNRMLSFWRGNKRKP